MPSKIVLILVQSSRHIGDDSQSISSRLKMVESVERIALKEVGILLTATQSLTDLLSIRRDSRGIIAHCLRKGMM